MTADQFMKGEPVVDTSQALGADDFMKGAPVGSPTQSPPRDVGFGTQNEGAQSKVHQVATLSEVARQRFGGRYEIPSGAPRNIQGTNTPSLHNQNMATDLYPGDSKHLPDVAAWAVTQPGVQHVIYNRRVWTPSRGWHPYDPNGDPHLDHVHVDYGRPQDGPSAARSKLKSQPSSQMSDADWQAFDRQIKPKIAQAKNKSWQTSDSEDDVASRMLAASSPMVRQMAAKADAPQEAYAAEHAPEALGMTASALSEGGAKMIANVIRGTFIPGVDTKSIADRLHTDKQGANSPLSKTLGLINPFSLASMGVNAVARPAEFWPQVGGSVARVLNKVGSSIPGASQPDSDFFDRLGIPDSNKEPSVDDFMTTAMVFGAAHGGIKGGIKQLGRLGFNADFVSDAINHGAMSLGDDRPVVTPAPTLSEVHATQIDTPTGPRFVSAEGYPFTEQRVPTKQIGVLKGLQYKMSEVTDLVNMVSSKLKDVTRWDPSAAGIVSLWRDIDGNLHALNAHHRLELANRLDVPDLLAHIYDEKDGIDFDQAKVIGALENMRENNGTAIDAAGVLRDSHITPDMLSEYGVSARSNIARDATGLAKLPDGAFALVSAGRVAEPVAAALGDAGISEGRTMRALDQAEKQGLSTRQQGEILAQKARVARAKADAAGSQLSIFDDAPTGADEDIHWGTETKIEDAVAKQLARDQKLLEAIARGKAAGETVVDRTGQFAAASHEEIARQMIRTSQAIQDAISNEALTYEQNPSPQALGESAVRVAELARSEAANRLPGSALGTGGTATSPPLSDGGGAGSPGVATATKAQGAESFRATVRDHLSQGSAFGIERLAEDHGISTEEAQAIHDSEAASDPGTTLDTTLELLAENIKKGMEQMGKSRGKRGGSTPVFGQIAGHVALFAIKAIRGGISFARWAAGMNSRFGPKIEGFLKNAWDKARLGIDEVNNTIAGAMSTTKRVLPDIAQAAREYMGADTQGRAIWNYAKPFIDRLGGEGFFDGTLYPTLAQDRLYGIRIAANAAQMEIHQWWQAAHLAKVWPSDIETTWANSQAKALVHAAGGGDTVEALLENGDYNDAMQTAIDTLDGVINVNNDILTPDQYAANRSHPAFNDAMAWYKEHVEPKMIENHERWGGVRTERLGELDTYAPLVRETGATATGAKGAAFKEPTNMGNRMASGTSAYTIDPARVSDTVIARTKGSARAYLTKLLNDRGLVRRATDTDRPTVLPNGKTVPIQFRVGGKSYDAMRVRGGTGTPLTIMKNGQVIHVPGADTIIPSFLHKEVGQFLDRGNQPFELRRNPLTNAYEMFAKGKIVGVTEPIAHGINTMGYAASTQPVIGSNWYMKALSTLPTAVVPGFKTLMSFADRMAIDVTHPEFYEDAVDLARRGLLPTRAGQILGKAGKGLKYGPKNVVFGDTGLDLRNRVALLRYARENLSRLEPDSTRGSQRIYDFVSGAGTYTYGLDSAMERSLKSSRFAPFATAAKSKVVGGIKAVAGTSPLPQSGAAVLPARFMQVATGGAVAYASSWYLMNKILGNDPDKQKLGDIPIPKDWPVFGGRTFKMGYAMPYTNAGVVDSGIKAYTDAIRSGQSAEQARAAVVAAWTNAGLKPVAGSPALNFGLEAATGKAPYVESETDRLTGKASLGLLTVGPGGPGSLENFLTAGLGDLPFGSAAKDLGVVPEADWIEKKRPGSMFDRVVEGLVDTLMPGAFRPSGRDIDAARLQFLSQRDQLAKQGKGEELSHDEAEELADLKANAADAKPAGKKAKRPKTETDTILGGEGRTQSGSKRKAKKSGLIGMNEKPTHRWENGDMVRIGS